MHRRLILFAIATLLVACSPREYEVVRVVNADAMRGESWVGTDRERLIGRWGRPTRIDRDADGTEVLIYRHVRLLGYETGPEPSGTGNLPGTTATYRQGGSIVMETGIVEQARDVAKFWLDGQGRVAREWIDVDLLRRLRKKHGDRITWFPGNQVGESVPMAPDAATPDGD